MIDIGRQAPPVYTLKNGNVRNKGEEVQAQSLLPERCHEPRTYLQPNRVDENDQGKIA